MKYTMFKNKKGFTLIELLIVIAIIGILAAMILANLATARAKAMDASASATNSALRAQAAIWFDDHPAGYTGMCGSAIDYTSPSAIPPADPQDLTTLLNGIANESRSTGARPTRCRVPAGGQTYTVSFLLNYIPTGSPLNTFCVDSTGFAGKVADGVSNGGVKCQ